MSKTLKIAQIEMPAHLGVFPEVLPVFKVKDSFLGNGDPKEMLQKRINKLNEVFGIKGKVSDAGDRLLLQDKENIRVLQIYKASESFLYFDRSLVSAIDPKYSDKILSAESAKQRAQTWLHKNDLLTQYAVHEGTAYTRVTSFDTDKNQYSNMDSDEKGYDTEIKACFGFQIHKTPVLGAGAKIMVSYVEDSMSQLAHFWRTPQTITPEWEQKIFPPESVKKFLARDGRFTHLDSAQSKIRITEIKLGYYALPPYAFQQFYIPVYQLQGIIETRGGHNAQGLEAQLKKKGSIVKETLQYYFNYFLPAGNLSLEEYKRSGFPPSAKDSVIF